MHSLTCQVHRGHRTLRLAVADGQTLPVLCCNFAGGAAQPCHQAGICRGPGSPHAVGPAAVCKPQRGKGVKQGCGGLDLLLTWPGRQQLWQLQRVWHVMLVTHPPRWCQPGTLGGLATHSSRVTGSWGCGSRCKGLVKVVWGNNMCAVVVQLHTVTLSPWVGHSVTRLQAAV